MRHQYGYFNAPSGHSQYYQCWLPAQPIKAVVLIVHGLAEHSGRYMNLVNRFVPQGFAVFGFDHIGHGESEGSRTYIKSFSQFVEGLDIMVDTVSKDYPNQPIILFGHSMGGLITSHYLSTYQHKVSAAVLSAPAIQTPPQVTALHKIAARLLVKLLPRMYLNQLDVNGISRNQEVVDAYQLDPLVNSKGVTVKLGYEIIQAMESLVPLAHKIALPVIVLQGTHDALVDPNGASQLIDSINSDSKELKLYKGLFHELINEPEREIVLNDIELWLEQQFDFGEHAEPQSIAQVRRLG